MKWPSDVNSYRKRANDICHIDTFFLDQTNMLRNDATCVNNLMKLVANKEDFLIDAFMSILSLFLVNNIYLLFYKLTGKLYKLNLSSKWYHRPTLGHRSSDSG